MPLVDAFEQSKREAVMQGTWGHLAAKPGRKYYGYAIFALCEDGLYALIKYEFDDVSGPWHHQHLLNFISKKAKDYGTIYKFTGYYKAFKNGNCLFSGKTEVIAI